MSIIRELPPRLSRLTWREKESPATNYGRSCPRSCDGAKGSLWPSGNLLSGGWAATPTSSQAGGPSRDRAVHAATAASLCAGHAQQLGGESILAHLLRENGAQSA